MKILFVNTNIGYGGASKMMVWVANILSEKGYDVSFLTYRDDEILQPVSRKVKHIHLPLEPVSGGRKGIMGTVKAIRGFIKKERFDLAIAFLIPSQLRLSLAAAGLPIKILYSQRGDPYSYSGGSRLMDYITRWSFRQADGYVFQTVGAKAYYSSEIQSISKVIPNPVVPLSRTSDREGAVEKRIVNIARLDVRQKRQDILIDAFKSVSSQFPDYILELYGDGPDKALLERMASDNSRIRFKGKTSDVVSAVQNATCTVLSSDSEGIPNALLESMSLGVPSVSTDCSPGGAAMLIDNYKNGIITPKGDVSALAEAVKFIIQNPEKAEDMGKNAMEINNIYSEERIAEQWIEYIEGMF